MSFFKNLFAIASSDSVVSVGGFSMKELNDIKKNYRPSAEFTQSYKVSIDKLEKDYILDLIKNGFDVKATTRYGNPFIYYAKDQETFDVMVYFGADPDFNHVDTEKIDVIKMSAFIWDRYWDQLKNFILSPSNPFSDPLTRETDMSKFDLLLMKGVDIDNIKQISFIEKYNYVYAIVFYYIWFGGDDHYRAALNFIEKVKPNFNRTVVKNCYGVSIKVPYQLYYFLEVFNVAKKNELQGIFSRYEHLFGSFDFSFKLDHGSNLFFLNALNHKEDEIKYVDFLVSHDVDPRESNSDGISFYSWVMNNKKGRKRLVDYLESLSPTTNEKETIPSAKKESVALEKPLPRKKNSALYDGLFLLELLQNDVIYFHEDEIVYRDGKHDVNSAWFNQTEIHKYPNILKEGQNIVQQLIDFCKYVESNPNLTVPSSKIGKDLLVHLYGENLTGILAINLFADHFLKVSRPNEDDKNKLLVLVETRLINSIPNYKQYLYDFFKTVIDYNPLHEGKLEIIDISFANWDVGQPKKKKRPQPKKESLDADYLDSIMQAMIFDQDLDRFNQLLSGRDINQIRAANNVTLLHVACARNLTDFAFYLIDKFIDVNVLTTDNSAKKEMPYSLPIGEVTALQLACQFSNIPLIKKLLEAGANANQANQYKFAPLMKAAQKDSTDAIRLLIEHGANIEAVNIEGGTSLYFAAEENKSNAAKLLVESGANVNVQTNLFWTPIAYFIKHGNTAMVQFLLEHGANFDYEQKIIGLGKMTGLASMIEDGNYSPKMLDLLIQHEYPVNAFVNGFHTVAGLEIFGESKDSQSLAKRIGYDYNNVSLFTGGVEPEAADEKVIAEYIKNLDYARLRDYYIQKEINLNNFNLFLKGVSTIIGKNQKTTPEQIEKLHTFFRFYTQNGATLDMILDLNNDRKTFLMYILTQFSERTPRFSSEWLSAIAEALINNGCNINASDGEFTPLDLVNQTAFKFSVNEETATHITQLLSSKGAKTFQEYYLSR